MPVPWPEKDPGTPAERGPAISKVENRAITVQQLRDLHAFIERLCKTRQLKRQLWEQVKNEAGEDKWVKVGRKTLSVFEVNMYDITDEVIKPVIEYVEKKRRGGKARTIPGEPEPVLEGYSWVELVSQGVSQEPDIMFSHSWKGRFQDFMTTVNKLERSLNYGGRKKIWICTFAINQFGEDFGESLTQSPFHKVVDKVYKVVLVVDRAATSLQRTWCAFELHLAYSKNKDLAIFTSMGKVGKEVKNGPLADAIGKWDVMKTDATEKADRRQILNFLVKPSEEKDGLKKKEDGTLEISSDKRKMVEDDIGDKKYHDGRLESPYEAQLFKEYEEQFEKLNKAIRATVNKAAFTALKQDPCCDTKKDAASAESSPKKDRPQSASGQRSLSRAGSAARLQRSSSKGSLTGGTPGTPSKASSSVKLPVIGKQESEPAAAMVQKKEAAPPAQKQEAAPPAQKQEAAPPVQKRDKVAMEMRGITLGEMRKAVKLMRDLHWDEHMLNYKESMPELKEAPQEVIVKAGKEDWQKQTVKEVVKKYMYRVDPERWKKSFAADVSYAERVYPEEGHAPQYIINDSNDQGFQYTMDALEWMAEALQLTDKAVLFMSAFCVRDWDSEHFGEQKIFSTSIESLIRNSYGWITVLGETKKSILRSQRMDQLQHCFCAARPIYFACDTGILAGLQPFTGTSYGHNGACWEFGVFSPLIANVLLKANWERDAVSKENTMQVAIADRIRREPGGFTSFETRLACAAAGPVLRDAVLNPDRKHVAKVARLVRRRGLRINSRLLRGALGETPLHIAAAVGNVGAMQVLMEAKADPDAEDNILETPMHYAAMAGHAAAASCLLSRGANARVESAYAESPLRVAKQNPAAFLWRQPPNEPPSSDVTNHVAPLLESWERALDHMVEISGSSTEDENEVNARAKKQPMDTPAADVGADKQQAALKAQPAAGGADKTQEPEPKVEPAAEEGAKAGSS